eukprot:Platyproteum_vivax@DN10521_c0_g1_i1.p1
MGRKLNSFIIFCGSILGILICLYAIHVHQQAHLSSDYEAACDFASWAKCSRVLTSKYSRLLEVLRVVPQDSPLNLSNSELGLAYYLILTFYPILQKSKLVTVSFAALSVASLVVSCYLGYVLVYILHDFCAVCVSIYCVNIIVFLTLLSEISIAWSKPNNKSPVVKASKMD